MSTDASLTPLSEWAQRCERRRRAACVLWMASLIIAGTATLCDDHLLFAPVLPLLVGIGWLVGVRLIGWWYLGCERRAGHPLVRAYAPSVLTCGRPLSPGWQETLIPGSLQLTDAGWSWHPSPVMAGEYRVLRWPHREVEAVTATPLWAPALAAPSAQLRIYVTSGVVADLLIWDPARLGLAGADPAGQGGF